MTRARRTASSGRHTESVAEARRRFQELWRTRRTVSSAGARGLADLLACHAPLRVTVRVRRAAARAEITFVASPLDARLHVAELASFLSPVRDPPVLGELSQACGWRDVSTIVEGIPRLHQLWVESATSAEVEEQRDERESRLHCRVDSASGFSARQAGHSASLDPE